MCRCRGLGSDRHIKVLDHPISDGCVDSCLSFCPFSFGHCVLRSLRFTGSDYPFVNQESRMSQTVDHWTMWVLVDVNPTVSSGAPEG
jgi:hypothetical protein